MRTRGRRLLIGGAALLVLFLSGCATKIGNILADPARYNNRNVTVQGNVTHSVGLLVAGGYQVDDNTGKLIVLSNGPTPPKGSRVRVSGRVQSGVTLMGKSYGTTLRQERVRISR